MPCCFKNEDGVTSFTCYRGSSIPRFNGKVKDKRSNIWWVRETKEEFERTEKISVYSKDGKIEKRFMTSFLEWVENVG